MTELRPEYLASGIAYGAESARLFFLAVFPGDGDLHAAFRESEDVLHGDLVIGHSCGQHFGTRFPARPPAGWDEILLMRASISASRAAAFFCVSILGDEQGRRRRGAGGN